jgi:hypothetical protein
MRIKTIADLESILKNGPYAWPGGYPLYFVTQDGGVLSFKAVEENRPEVDSAIADDNDPQWRVVACETNWEDPELICDHTNERIESAYAEPESEV